MADRRRLAGVCVALCVGAALGAAPGAGATWLDPSFGVGGLAQIQLSRFTDSAVAAHVSADGTVLVAADAELRRSTRDDFILTRLREDGTPDPAFGVDGLVRVDIAGQSDSVAALTEMPDGRIVLAGHAFLGRNSTREAFAFVRLLADGSLDESFGAGGKVIVPASAFDRDGECPHVSDLAPMADGRLVAVGGLGCGGEGGYMSLKLMAMRLLPDGSLDPSFHGEGRWSSWAGCTTSAVSVLADGGLLIAGSTGSSDYCLWGQMRLIRLTTDGQYAATWGRNGRVSVRFPGFRYSYARAMAIDAQGRALLVGEVGTRRRLALARVLADGSLDQSFGSGGRLTADFHPRRESRGQALALAADGSAVIAVAVNHAASWRRYLNRFVLARVTADGQLDGAFGAGGWLRAPFGSRNASAEDVVVDQAGRVVAVGSAESRPLRSDFTAVRLR